MASFAMNPDELGATTAATLYEEDDNYSIDLVQAFEAAFQEIGGQIVSPWFLSCRRYCFHRTAHGNT